MKKLLYKFALVFAACCFVAVACDKDEEEEITPTPTPGTAYDVYFPSQTTAFTFAADAEETAVVLEVCRVNTEGGITVPVALSDTGGGIYSF